MLDWSLWRGASHVIWLPLIVIVVIVVVFSVFFKKKSSFIFNEKLGVYFSMAPLMMGLLFLSQLIRFYIKVRSFNTE